MVNSKYISEALSLTQEVEMINIAIRKNSKSPYLYARYSFQGKQKEFSTGETDNKRALRKAKEIIANRLAQDKHQTSIGSRPFQDAYERKLINGISKNDKGYLNWFRKHLKTTPIAEIDEDLLWKLKQKYIKEKTPIKNKSVNRAFNTLHGLLTDCYKWKWIKTLPKHDKLKEEPDEPRRAIGKDEANKLREACFQIGKPYAWDIFNFSIQTGFRFCEIENIEIKNICLQTGRYLMPDQKNDEHNEWIYLNDIAKEIIDRNFNSNNKYLFNFTNWRRIQERVRKVADLKDFTPHCLRHTAITNVASRCTDKRSLKRYSRHKTDVSLERYIHLLEEEKMKDTAELASSWHLD